MLPLASGRRGPRTLAALAGIAVVVALVHAWALTGWHAAPRTAAGAAATRAVTLAPAAAPGVLLASAELGALALEAPMPMPLPIAPDAAPVAEPLPAPPARKAARRSKTAIEAPAQPLAMVVSPVVDAALPSTSLANEVATPLAHEDEAGAETAPLLLAAATPAAPAAAAPPPPVYRTRIPAAAQVSYRLSRSGLTGSGELDWRPESGSYSLRLEGKLPVVGTLLTQTSRGGFDAAGLAPERYTDKRLRRGEQAANFQRAAGRVSFSGGAAEVALLPGMQDRLSVMLQLAAIANAWGKPPPVGQRYGIDVVGARGDVHRWAIRYEGAQTLALPGGPVAVLRFLREPESPHDTRAEFWLDPARQYLPVRVLLTDGDRDALELLRSP